MRQYAASLAQYSERDAYGAFIADVNWRYGSYGRDSIKKMLEDLYFRYKGRAETAVALAAKMPSFAGKEAMQNEAQVLKDDLMAYRGFVNNADDPAAYTDDQLKRTFLEFNDIILAINELNLAIQEVTGGISLIDADSRALADEAKESITAAELQEIQEKAGSSEAYFTALYQSLYAKKLMEQYAQYLPKSVVENLEYVTSRNDELIKNAEPSGMQAALENTMVGNVLDYYEAEGNPFRKPWDILPAQWKWILGIGAGTFILWNVARIAGIFRRRK